METSVLGPTCEFTVKRKSDHMMDILLVPSCSTSGVHHRLIGLGKYLKKRICGNNCGYFAEAKRTISRDGNGISPMDLPTGGKKTGANGKYEHHRYR